MGIAHDLAQVRESYADEIKALRKRGLTVTQVAARVGMSERSVYRLLAEARAAKP